MAARQGIATLLAVLAGLLAVAGAQCWSLSRGVIAQAPFADRAVQALHRDAVREAVSAEIAAQVDARLPDAIASPQRVGRVVDRMVATSSFEQVFHEEALSLNRALFHDAGSGGTLDVGLAGVLEPTSPRLAQVVGDTSVTVLSLRDGGTLRWTNRAADAIRTLGVLLPVVAVALLALALLLAPRRWAALGVAGLGAAAGGALALLGLGAAHARVEDRIELTAAVGTADARRATDAIWDVFAGDLRTIAFAAIAAGLVLAAVGLLAGRVSR